VRIDILAIGSQGDVRPAVALALGLRRAGHRIRIVTLDGFEELCRAHGLDCLSIGGSPRDIAKTAAGRDWIERRRDPIGFLRGFVGVAESLIATGIANYWPACRDVEALLVTSMGLPIGMHIAERLQRPLMRVSFAPTRHDWADPRNLVTTMKGHVAAFVWATFRLLMWSQLRRTTNTARASILALPPLPMSDPFRAMDRQRVPVLDAYSPAVAARPAHWDRWIHVTGYWFLDDAPGWLPPGDLVDFLGSGAPPVFVGFGSTPFPQPVAATDLVVEALTRAGRRGVIVAGGSGLRTGRLADGVLSVDAVPHGWLFPQVSAAVHHGGAGVTGAALRADLPSVVVPVFGDQPFWARRVFQLGAGPRPIPVKQLTAEALAGAIRLTAGQGMRSRAAAIGEKIRRENGVACAVGAIEDYLAVALEARRAS
jgi:sterol 3beta-glucosyltransferase